MPKEIERKFLVINEDWRYYIKNTELIRQGYLCIEQNMTIRVRTIEDGHKEKGFLTIKATDKDYNPLIRDEFEYEIPILDANTFLCKLCIVPIIEKYRYKINYGNFVWEIDQFLDPENMGLIVAEVELKNEDQDFPLPPWIGQEVTYDSNYLNCNLVKYPYNTWKNKEK